MENSGHPVDADDNDARDTDVEMYEENVTSEPSFRGVTKSHHVRPTDRTCCQNEHCRQSFTYPSLRRPHHCRRCGEVFCRPCLQYRRRLNQLAQPDANGILCKVCLRCYEERTLVLGCQTRSRTEEFRMIRTLNNEEMRQLHCQLTIEMKNASIVSAFWREQFQVDIHRECLRLLQGFKGAVSSSETKKVFHEISDLVNVPTWQKSMFWKLESSTASCRHCGGKLGARKKLYNCRVCGVASCKKCANKELLLYLADKSKSQTPPSAEVEKQPRLAVIRVQGSPEVEPHHSLLLYVCDECKSEIVSKQIQDADWFVEKLKPPDMMSEVMRMDKIFRLLKERLIECVTKIEEEALTAAPPEANTDGDDTSVPTSPHTGRRSKRLFKSQHMETAKHLFESYLNEYGTLRNLYHSLSKEVSKSQETLVKNYMTAKNHFYLETKHRLSRVTNSQS